MEARPLSTQLGFTRVGHLKLSKSDIFDFDRERVWVRGYGLSIGRNPSPGSLCDPTSPFGRGEPELAAGSDSKFMARTLLVPRLQIALAVIAALRTPWRAVAAGFGLIARAR